MEEVMGDSYTDREAADYYADPQHRSISGKKPRRRKNQGLSSHVPVRFRSDTLELIRQLAAADGTTVSGWIRRVCDREIQRRLPPFTEVTYEGRIWLAVPEPQTETTETTRLEDTFARSA